MKLSLLLAVASMFAFHTRAATYYVVVAGLGGEADYEQRFAAAAKDLDRILGAARASLGRYRPNAGRE